MHRQDDSQQNAELRQAFLRHLPRRLDTLLRRGQRLASEGWDINALNLLFRELQTLAGACGRYGLLDLGERLFALETFLAEFVERVDLPDAEHTQAFLELLQSVDASGNAGPVPAAAAAASGGSEAIDRSDNGFPLQLVAPADYWKRFGVTTAAPVPAAAVAAAPATPVAAAAAPTAAATAEPARATGAAPARGAPRKIYHLTDGNALACEIDQKLELAGYELSLFDNSEELREMLGALPPHLVLLDAAFLGELESIGEALRTARARVSHRLALLALSELGDLAVRLRAMRAGADAFVTVPVASADIMARVAELTEAETDDPFRVLIVEDDRSQAIFAESILRKAGMATRMVTEALSVLDELERFRPDLILMDLHMPDCDGMELTAIIREREEFVSTPIVFLSGENDTEKHFEALSAGGDDFLSKPIRPKHLISAVTNRLRRARHLARRSQLHNPRDAVSGLYDRAFLLDRLNAHLADEASRLRGGLMLAEIDGAATLREKLGLIAFDALLAQVGAFLAAHVEASELVARFGDASFLVLSPDADGEILKQRGLTLRDRVAREGFDPGAGAVTVELGFGICPFAADLGDAGAMLNAAERALGDARRSGGGHVGLYRPRPDRETLLLETLQSALRADAFQLLFQPIASLAGDEEEQFQALLRLRGDGGVLHTAAEVVPVAERAGLIGEIDRWVLTRCLMVLTERARAGRPVRIFAAQSVLSVLDPAHLAWLRQQLETRRIDGSRLVLELRVLDPVDDATLQSLVAFSSSLHEQGVLLALGGVDASAAVATWLDALMLDFIRLAPGYLGERREEMRTLVAQAHERRRRVIAPQVEDAQSAAQLWSAGVDYIQGNFVQQADQELNYDFRAAAP
ncbi:MAG TPA: EAL domain-containing protein [Rhodanobacteraceae bacterium]|nr:EAL domain-containing protein [Rhodanobacteraceae bacterium]